MLGKTIVRLGEAGTGQTAKACNQILVAVTIEAVSEALVLASKAGVDPERLIEVLSGGLAGNRVMEVRRRNFLEHDFTPGFKLELHHKDLGIALRTARELGVYVPVDRDRRSDAVGARGRRRRRSRSLGAADGDRAAVLAPYLGGHLGGPRLRVQAARRQAAREQLPQVGDHGLAGAVEAELGVRGQVAGEDRVRRRQDRVVGCRGLALEHVEAGGGDLVVGQRGGERGLVDELAARGVDDDGVAREQRELGRAEQPAGASR